MALRPFFLSILGLLVLPLAASAQSLGDVGTFSITASPQYPRPFEQVTITPLSGQLDITNATMTVTVNKKQTYKGNAAPVGVPVGAVGTLTTVTVTLTSNGTSSTRSLSFRPQDLSLIVEPLASTPVLYPGKPAVPLGGSVRIVAVADLRSTSGKALDPSQLSYNWTVDEARLSVDSGIGRDTILVASPAQYRSRTVSLIVTSQDGSAVSGNSLTLTDESPVVRVYERDPLLGILFDRAIVNTFSIPSAEKTLFVAPYALPSNGTSPRLQWFLNGSAAQTGPVITLRPTGTGGGSASLSIVASVGDSATATANLSLTFGAPKGGLGIFGL
ncbi:hypothetical protein COU19_01660 [Candidatus Kaiserbacteria bacterium CG10_big_fil_rev_8_21_14_0_10_56_12]|uniref:Uncharacterized protein n=1 Tax=Candidatus Kaiserbacteria bacterium CG10_big_fil_rev_8_21_14_0_10_56_12 TaxID=1974611 RepID=A0A2H0U9W4_9BACT|nr:MAG: hypothetical protein COU19_01660 [Candidatus Kaiserbacteria bacterium CG10_big_fil_rev_8_21_14_0_10_56_12]